MPHGATHLIQLEGGVCCIVGAILEVGAHVVPHHAHVAGPGLLGVQTRLPLRGEPRRCSSWAGASHRNPRDWDPGGSPGGSQRATNLLVVQQELLEVVEGDLAELGAIHVPGAQRGHQGNWVQKSGQMPLLPTRGSAPDVPGSCPAPARSRSWERDSGKSSPGAA